MSRFPVIRCLSNMTVKMVAEHMKAIFSELGVPKTLVSDSRPCYTGDQFKKTMSYLGITHITTSPHHHQSNGLTEGYVKIIKNLLSKAKETGQSQSTDQRLSAKTHLHHLSSYKGENHQLTYLSGRGKPK